MKYIIDRIEWPYAVCEDENGKMVDIPLDNIDCEVHEKDTLIKSDGTYTVSNTVSNANEPNRALFDKLFKKGQ